MPVNLTKNKEPDFTLCRHLYIVTTTTTKKECKERKNKKTIHKKQTLGS